MASTAKSLPIKAAPVLHLKINQQSQDGENDGCRQNLFFAHRRIGLLTATPVTSYT